MRMLMPHMHAMLLRMHAGTAFACARFLCLLMKTLAT
jgi:hypothetical protein